MTIIIEESCASLSVTPKSRNTQRGLPPIKLLADYRGVSVPKMKLDCGIVGLGNIGTIYADCLTDEAMRNIVGRIRIAETNHSKCEQYLTSRSQIEFVSDYCELDGCDLIIIALPTALHLETIKFFCGRTGLLLVEKPLGATYRESLEIAEYLRAAKQCAMCGLTGLYHPEFRTMYEQLGNVGNLISVSETLQEAGPHLASYLRSPHGVLTENGIHTLHRFLRIGKQLLPDQMMNVVSCELARTEFGGTDEDSAKGTLMIDGARFEFKLAFRNSPNCDNGLPIEYVTVVRGNRGFIRVIGWEKCESVIDGDHIVHYEHPDGPLGRQSQYARIRLGIRNQLEACFDLVGRRVGLHFTIDEVVDAQKLIESCYQVAGHAT